MTPVQTAVAPETSPVTTRCSRTPRSGADAHRRGAPSPTATPTRHRRRRSRPSSPPRASPTPWRVARRVRGRVRSRGQPVSLAAFPICTANHLHVSLSGEPDGAAGTIYYTLKLVNNGPECTVAPVVARGFNTTSSELRRSVVQRLHHRVKPRPSSRRDRRPTCPWASATRRTGRCRCAERRA